MKQFKSYLIACAIVFYFAGICGCTEDAIRKSPSSTGISNADGKTAQASAALVWRKADLTNFTSYPDPKSEECIKYNGCKWAGYFAFVSGKKSESWVKANNIVAVHSKDASKYKLKKLRLRRGSKTIDVTVYDMCSDKDCNGCCTKNCKKTGFLIDIEKYTMQRFGYGSGTIDWTCLNCN